LAERILILGARRFALEVADLISDMPGVQLEGFVENQERERCRTALIGLPVYWVDELARFAGTHSGVCAFGSTRRKIFVEQAAEQGFPFTTLVHPAARLSRTSTAGAGTVLWPGVIVSGGTRIGEHVIVNRGALIGHDVEIGNCVTVAPGANIAGCCRIASGSYVGMGAVIVERVTVGAGSVIAAGSVVSKDVPDHVMVAGMPAVVVKRDVDGL
jgi:acetyltransferase EpsM